MEAVACHSVSHSVALCPHVLACSVRCSESSVWFKASGFCDTVSPPLDSSRLPCCVTKSLQCWISRTNPFSCPNHLQMIQIGVGRLGALRVGQGQLSTSSPTPVTQSQPHARDSEPASHCAAQARPAFLSAAASRRELFRSHDFRVSSPYCI